MDLEAKVEEVQQIADWEAQQRQEVIKQMNDKQKEAEETIKLQNVTIEELENQLIEQSKCIRSQEDTHKILEVKTQLEKNLREAKEESKATKSEWDKLIALLNQKVSFYEVQLVEAENQQCESKKAYEALMKAFKTIEAEKDYSTDNVKDMIQNQRSEYIKEITNLQSKFDETKQRLTSQVESLTEKNNSLDLEYRIKLSELETQNGQLSQQIEELLAVKCQNEEAIRVQETEKLELIKSLERQYKEKIKRLETDLNDRATKHQQALEDIEDEKSRHFMQMKDFYETEKLRIEARIQEERKNYKLKFEQLQEDHEEQLKEEQEAHEDEVEMLRDEIKQLEYRCQETIQEAEQNHAMNMQKIEYLEQSLKETKESLANYQKESTIALNTHLHSYRSKEQLYNDKGEFDRTGLLLNL